MLLEALQSGDFRTRLQLQVPVRTRGTDGRYTVSWALLRSVWAAFIPLDNPTRPARNTWSSEGTENQFAGQQRAQQKHVIVIRAQPEMIETTWRFVQGTRVFNIKEALLLNNVKKMVRTVAQENVSSLDSATAAYQIVYDNAGSAVFDNSGDYVFSRAS